MATEQQVEWRLSAVEFDVLWREMDHGEPPYPLEVPSPGTTYDERDEIVEAIWLQLAQRGIVDADDDNPPPNLAEALGLLATGEVTIDGQFNFDVRVRALVARSGTRGAMVVQEHNQLLLRMMHGARLAAAMVELLPRVPPVPGQSISMPNAPFFEALSKLSKGEGGLWDFEQALRKAGLSGRDARWVTALVQGEGNRGAQFGVNIRRADGKYDRIDYLSWYANQEGSVLMHRRAGSGDDWVTIAPVDAERLVGRLAELTGSHLR